MPAGVLPLSDRICRDFRTLRVTAAAAASVATIALPPVLVYAPARHWLLIGLAGLYVGRKIWQTVRYDRVIRQLRLEERFFRQQMDRETLARCMRRSEHLWDGSWTLRGLRAVLARPLPRLLAPQEKTRLVQQRYHSVFRGMLPARLSPESILPLLAALWMIWHSFPIAVTMAAAALAGFEVIQLRLASGLRRRFDGYERALSQWTLGRKDFSQLFPRATTGYRHDLLYRADPIYLAGSERRSSSAGRPSSQGV